MKKATLIAITLVGIVIVSCSKKDYTCTCMTADSSGLTSTESKIISAPSKDHARAECNSNITANQYGGTVCDIEE